MVGPWGSYHYEKILFLVMHTLNPFYSRNHGGGLSLWEDSGFSHAHQNLVETYVHLLGMAIYSAKIVSLILDLNSIQK